MGESSQEKTEDATPKRLREARKKGDVAKSKDLTMVFVMICVFATVAVTTDYMSGSLKELMQFCFDLVAKRTLSLHDMSMAAKISLITLAKVLGPVLAVGFVAALIIGMMQVGAIFTMDPLKPKLEKLNPVEGFKNMFKVVTFIELFKNIIKLSMVIYIAYYTIRDYLQEILLSSQVTVVEAMQMTGALVYSFFAKVAVVFIVVALIDMGVQRWNYLKRHRMSKDEVKREYKQDEGDPHIKGERRRLHRDMVFGDVRKGVKKSDGVVSNPTHVAVAIKYDRQEMAAPEVVVKGQRQFAELILKVAREENVPIIRNIPLAWSLLQVDEGCAIPEDLYEPVAEILSMVYEMRERQTAGLTESVPEQPTAEKKGPTTFKPLG